MTQNDKYSIYDDSYAPAVATAAVASIPVGKLISRIKKEQALYDNTLGAQGYNWADKYAESRLKDLTKNLSSSAKKRVFKVVDKLTSKVPNSVKSAAKSATNVVTGKQKKAKQSMARNAYTSPKTEKDFEQVREQIRKADPVKDADKIVDLENKLKEYQLHNEINKYIQEQQDIDRKIKEIGDNKSLAAEKRRLNIRKKELDNTIDNFIEDPKAARKVETDRVKRMESIKSGKAPYKTPTKLNKKLLAGIAGVGGANVLGGKLYDKYIADPAGDAYDSNLDAGNDSFGNKILGVLDKTGEFAQIAPGAASAATAAGVLGNYGLNRVKDIYNVTDDPYGMGKWDSLKQFTKDTGQAIYDNVGHTARKVGRGFETATTGGGVFTSNNYNKMRQAQKEEIDKQYLDRKKKRYVDPRSEEFKQRDIKYENERKLYDAQNMSDEELRAYGEKLKNTGTREYVKEVLKKELMKEQVRIRNLEKKLAGLEGVRTPEADIERANIKKQIKSSTGTIEEKIAPKFKLLEDSIDDIDLQRNFNDYLKQGKYDEYMETATERMKRAGKQATKTAENLYDDGSDFVKQKIEDAKPWWKKAKDLGKEKLGMSSTVGDGAQPMAEPDMSKYDTPKKKSLLRSGAAKAVRPVTAVSKTAGILSVPQAMEGAATIVNDLYNSDDKVRYARDTTGEAIDAISEIPEQLYEDYKDYKAIYQDPEGGFLPAFGKFSEDYLQPLGTGFLTSSANLMTGLGVGTGLVDEEDATFYSNDPDAKPFETVKEKVARDMAAYQNNGSQYDEPVEYRPSQDPAVQKRIAEAQKTKPKPNAPGTESTPEEIVRAKQAQKLSAEREAFLRAKYGGYTSGQEYADKYGVEYINPADGRYGKTPVYKGVDEFGNPSYSDVPINVADPSKYDRIAAETANQARHDFLTIEAEAKRQAGLSKIPPALRGLYNSKEEYDATPVKTRAEMYLQSLKAQNSKSDADRDFQYKIAKEYADKTTRQGVKQYLSTKAMTDRPLSGYEENLYSYDLNRQIDRNSWGPGDRNLYLSNPIPGKEYTNTPWAIDSSPDESELGAFIHNREKQTTHY